MPIMQTIIKECVPNVRVLEYQLEEIQHLSNEARFLDSRIQSGLITLDINAYNLANSLEQIRQKEASSNWQIHFQTGNETKSVDWNANQRDIPILENFQYKITKLNDHRAYLKTQANYLQGLQEIWRLYLEKRQTQLSEHFNTLGTILIFLVAGSTGMVTLNVNKLGLNFENPLVYFGFIFVLIIPVLWHILLWMAKLLCCIFHGTRFNEIFCHQIMEKTCSIEFFRMFKPKSKFKLGDK